MLLKNVTAIKQNLLPVQLQVAFSNVIYCPFMLIIDVKKKKYA